MDWLEQNIDAYRIVSEILGELRLAVRRRLEQIHGEEWFRKGLPEEIFKRLVDAKEREKSIDWYEGQYQQIMDYAVFPDLIAILEKNPEAFQPLVDLAPSTALLNARFMELDVMRAKLGRARPISETELSFLGTFHMRFRKAVEQVRVLEVDVEGDEISEPGEPAAAPASDAAEQPVETQPQASPPKRPVRSAAEPADNRSSETVEQAPPPPASPVSADDEGPTDVLHQDGGRAEDEIIDADEPSSAERRPADAGKAIGPKKLREALSSNDHRTVLRELYREVTSIAEGVWTNDVTPAALVWDEVTASDWYESNFSRLGLQPLSVFYDVTAKVEKKMNSGAGKAELQEFLKETNFAKTLLALRDMFQANNI